MGRSLKLRGGQGSCQTELKVSLVPKFRDRPVFCVSNDFVHNACWSVRDGLDGRDSRKATQAVESGEGSLSGCWFHQAAGDRLLRSDRSGDDSASGWACAYTQTLSQRRRRRILLRKERASVPARLGEDCSHLER